MDRNEEICKLILEGSTFQEVGVLYGLSRQRVQQIFRKKYPQLDKYEFGRGKTSLMDFAEKRQELVKKMQRLYKRDTLFCANALQQAQSIFFVRKRQNNKKRWEWSITMSDLEWHTHCPALGLELDWFAEKRQENSPSIDRIDSKLGYIPGNVHIISWRANRIKNDATLEELTKIVGWLSLQVK